MAAEEVVGWACLALLGAYFAVGLAVAARRRARRPASPLGGDTWKQFLLEVALWPAVAAIGG